MKEITNAQKNYLNIMNALWDFFTSKTGAFIIGVGAIVIGMYQFYISKPILKYEAEHTNIVSSTDVTDLKVTVREKEYKDMYLTTLTLMNTGSQALDGDDVSKVGHDPIRIVVPKDARLVSYNINKKQTSPAVAASLEPYDGDILIRFDYLNPDNQITVSLLHEKKQRRLQDCRQRRQCQHHQPGLVAGSGARIYHCGFGRLLCGLCPGRCFQTPFLKRLYNNFIYNILFAMRKK